MSTTQPTQPTAPLMPAMPGQAPAAPAAVMPVEQVAPAAPAAPMMQTAEEIPAQVAMPTTPVIPAQMVPAQEPQMVQPEVPQEIVNTQQEVVMQEAQPEFIHVEAQVNDQQENAMVTPVIDNNVVEQMQNNTAPQMPSMPNGGLDLAQQMSPEDEVTLNNENKEILPISVGGFTPIANCKTSAWGAFMKVLDFLAKDSSKDEVIMVEQGTMDTNKQGVFVHCDLKNVLGDITLNITSPSYSSKLLKTIKGGEFVQIFKEDATNSYVFCNIVDGRVFTRVKTKYAAGDADSFAKPPLLPEPTYQKEVSASDKEVIKTIIDGKSAIESDEPYRFGFSKHDNSLVFIGVGKDFTHFFQDQTIETDEYKVYYPFPVPRMDSVIIKFFKTADGACWLQTVNNVELASIICTEKIEIIDTTIEDFSF